MNTPPRHADARVARIVQLFESLAPSDLVRLVRFYAQDASFKDPFNDVRGVDAVRRVFEHMFDTLDEPRFVVHDIVVANLQVAKLILGPREALKPRFVWVPLDVRRPRSISLFAGIITMTPGTVSAELSDDHRHLLVHGLRVEDPDALAAEVKSRYETPIRELFE